MKLCSRCKKNPSLRESNLRGHSFCAPCLKEYQHEHYLKNLEKYAARAKKWKENNRDRSNANARRYKATTNGKRKTRQYNLKHEYGLTFEKFTKLLEAQGGACAICKKVSGKLHVDHDHRSDVVRGLLCGSCNRAIGLLHDDPAVAHSAAAYLGHHAVTLELVR